MTNASPSPQPAGAPLVSPARRRRLQECFEFGRRSVAQGNKDYAIDMFTECVAGDPGNLLYAQAFLDALHKKHTSRDKIGKLANWRSSGAKSVLKKAIARDAWEAIAKAAVDLLKINPWEVTALTALANVCQKHESGECELLFLKHALNTNPKDAELNRMAGNSLARQGHFDQAIVCWHRVEEALPEDEEAPKVIAQLSVQRALIGRSDAAELGAGQRFAPSGTNQRSPSKAGGTTAEPTRRERLEKAILSDPYETSHYVQLAELYQNEGALDDAVRVLNRALATVGGSDLQLLGMLEEARLQHMAGQVEIAQRRAQQEATDEATELAKQMKAEQARVELEIFAARSERHPDDGELRLELGIRLKRAGKFAEAAKSLQAAGPATKRKALAQLELGECLQYLKQYPKALECYHQAIAAAGEGDDETRKLALYRTALLAKGLQQFDVAVERLRELVTLDAQYRDAAERLDKIEAMRHK